MEVEAEVPNNDHGDNNEAANTSAYDTLRSLLGDQEWVENFATLMQDYSLTPLQFAVLSRTNEATVRHIYKGNPADLGPITLGLACKYGAEPGVISFLAKAKPDLVSFRFKGDDTPRYPISLAMSKGPGKGRPTEEDIKSLVEVWPECVAKSMEREASGAEDWYQFENPMQLCLRHGYSNDLLQFMLSKVPDKIESFEMIRVYDHDVQWIPKIVPLIHGEMKVVAHRIVTESPDRTLPWSRHVLHRILEAIPQNNCMNRLRIKFPTSFNEEDSEPESPSPLESIRADPSRWAPPRVDNLKLEFGWLPEDSFPEYCTLLDCLPHWPCLRTLIVYYGHFKPTTGWMVQLLEQGILEDLRMDISAKYTPTQRRKKIGTDEEEQPLLQPFFRALASNTSLKSLQIFDESQNEEFPEEGRKAYRRLLIDTLKGNATLQVVSMYESIDPDAEERFAGHDHEARTYLYYLKLNNHGRAVAREPTTPMSEFVELLVSAGQRNSLRDREYNYTDNIRHGLLREAIGIWAVSSADHQ